VCTLSFTVRLQRDVRHHIHPVLTVSLSGIRLDGQLLWVPAFGDDGREFVGLKGELCERIAWSLAEGTCAGDALLPSVGAEQARSVDV